MHAVTNASSPPRTLSLLAERLLLALLIGTATWLSLTLTRAPGSVSAVWVGNGIFVGWLLSQPTRQWPGYLVVGFVAEMTVRLLVLGLMPQRFGSSIMNLGEVLFIAGMVRRVVPDIGDPSHYFTLGRIATGSTLVACALSGLVVAGLATTTFGTSFARNFITWYAAHVVGMVIAAPFTLVVLRQGVKSIAVHERGAFVAWILVFVVIAGAVFDQSRYPLLFLLYPPLLWGAFRHRFAGVVVGVR